MALAQVKVSLTSNEATAKEQLGKIYYDGSNDKAYKYVQFKDAATAGQLVEFTSTSGTLVSPVKSAAVGRVAAGVALASMTDEYFGWIQIRGNNSAVKADGGVTAGKELVSDASLDGRVEMATTATRGRVIGYSLAADTTATTTTATVAADLRM